MRYALCSSTWDERERAAIDSVLDSGMYSMGERVREYEEAFARKMGSRYAVMVNSGSSANLVAVAALMYSGRLKRGDEVLVTAVSWSTTYFPLSQMGLRLRFVDVDRETLDVDPELLEAAVTPDTRMVCAVNLLGNPCDYRRINDICKRHGLILFEDNCESLGAVYDRRLTGTFGVAGTFSMYYSHHLYTMEGGMIVTDDEELYDYMLCVRAHGWTRNLPADSLIYHKTGPRFYEDFNFIMPGFNVRPLEIEAAAGLVQLDKMDSITAARRDNAEYLAMKIAEFPDLHMQREIGASSWYGFAIILYGDLASKRDALVERLAAADIETRPVMAGNFTRNSALRYLDYTIAGKLPAADYIHDHGFFIGNYGRDCRPEIDYFIETVRHAVGQL